MKYYRAGTESFDGAEGDYLCICVQDDGQGISEEDMAGLAEYLMQEQSSLPDDVFDKEDA